MEKQNGGMVYRGACANDALQYISNLSTPRCAQIQLYNTSNRLKNENRSFQMKEKNRIEMKLYSNIKQLCGIVSSSPLR